MNKYRLLQWNTWFKENPENVKDLLLDVAPDIACFQELTQNYPTHNFIDVPDFLARGNAYNCHFKMAQYWPSEHGNMVQGNAILSKYPQKSNNYVYIQDLQDDSFDDYAHQGRVLVFSEIDLKGTVVTIATTHMSYTHKFIETEDKYHEEERLIESVKGHDHNFILAGDFNVDEKSDFIATLSEVFTHVGPDFSNKTWTTKPFSYQGFEENNLNWRLDYVFATEDINVISTEIIDTNYSDHLPVLVTFEL